MLGRRTSVELGFYRAVQLIELCALLLADPLISAPVAGLVLEPFQLLAAKTGEVHVAISGQSCVHRPGMLLKSGSPCVANGLQHLFRQRSVKRVEFGS